MEFKVPQFLEIEDKIFGPFTFKQFVYMAGGLGICFMLYRVLGFWLGAAPILIVAGLSGALAFYRPNNKPFIDLLQSMVKYSFQNKLYIWEKKKVVVEQKRSIYQEKTEIYSNMDEEKLNQSKLRDLAWSLDVLDVGKQKETRGN